MAEAAGLVLPVRPLSAASLLETANSALFNQSELLTRIFKSLQNFKSFFGNSEKISSAIGDKIGNLLDLAKTQAKSPIQKIRDKVTKYYDLVRRSKWHKKVVSTLRESARAATSWIFRLIKFLAILAIFDPNGTFLASIIGFLADMAVTLINMIANALPKLIKTMISLIPKIVKTLVSAALKISDAIAGIFSNVSKFFPKDSFMGKLMEFGQFLFGKGGTIQRILGSIITFFDEISTLGFKKAFLNLLGNIVSALADLLLKLVPLLKSLVRNVLDFLLTLILQDILGLSSEATQKFVKSVQAIFDPVFQFLEDVFGSIKDLISGDIGFGQFLTNIVNSLLDNVLAILSGAGDLIKNILSSIMESVKDIPILSDIVNFIFGTLMIQIDHIIQRVKDVFKAVKQIFSAFVDLFSGEIGFGEFTKKVLGAIFDLFASIAESILVLLVTTLENIIEFIVSLGSTILDAMGKFFSSLWESIKGLFTGTGEKSLVDVIFDALKGIGDYLWDLLKTPLMKIATFFSALGRKIAGLPGIRAFTDKEAIDFSTALAIEKAAALDPKRSAEDIEKLLRSGPRKVVLGHRVKEQLNEKTEEDVTKRLNAILKQLEAQNKVHKKTEQNTKDTADAVKEKSKRDDHITGLSTKNVLDIAARL